MLDKICDSCADMNKMGVYTVQQDAELSCCMTWVDWWKHRPPCNAQATLSFLVRENAVLLLISGAVHGQAQRLTSCGAQASREADSELITEPPLVQGS